MPLEEKRYLARNLLNLDETFESKYLLFGSNQFSCKPGHFGVTNILRLAAPITENNESTNI